jgi:hypothetical protein
VNPAPPPLPYILPLSPAPPLTFFVCFNSQQIEPLFIKPKLISAQGHSGRVSSSLQDAIQHLDQDPETALTL